MADYTYVTPVPYEDLLEPTPNYQMNEGHHPSTATADSQVNSGTAVPHEPTRDEEELEAEEVAESKIDYLQLEFQDCFREHKSIRTHWAIYKFYNVVFTYIKLFVYNFLVLILGLPLAVLWGIIIAISAFIYTWIWGPALKTVLMWLYASVPLVLAFLRSVYRPFVDVSARIFRQIRLRSSVNGKATIHTKAD